MRQRRHLSTASSSPERRRVLRGQSPPLPLERDAEPAAARRRFRHVGDAQGKTSQQGEERAHGVLIEAIAVAGEARVGTPATTATRLALFLHDTRGPQEKSTRGREETRWGSQAVARGVPRRGGSSTAERLAASGTRVAHGALMNLRAGRKREIKRRERRWSLEREGHDAMAGGDARDRQMMRWTGDDGSCVSPSDWVSSLVKTHWTAKRMQPRASLLDFCPDANRDGGRRRARGPETSQGQVGIYSAQYKQPWSARGVRAASTPIPHMDSLARHSCTRPP